MSARISEAQVGLRSTWEWLDGLRKAPSVSISILCVLSMLTIVFIDLKGFQAMANKSRWVAGYRDSQATS